jgi:hypothetical protein
MLSVVRCALRVPCSVLCCGSDLRQEQAEREQVARVRKIAHASSGEQQKPPHVSASELQEWQPHGDRHAWQHKSLTNAVEELDASGQPITSLAAAVEVIARVPLDNARAIQRWVTLHCLPWEDGCRHWPLAIGHWPLATLPATLPR